MATSAAATSHHEAEYARRWWTLVVLGLSLLVVLGGNSNVNVAVPTISRDLHASTAALQWVVAAYSLVFAGLLFPAAAISDRFGRKTALQLGLVAFMIGAALAAESSSIWELVGCRAIMGMAAAFIMPSTLSILVNVFPRSERAKAIAFFAIFTGIAGVIGPVISGWLLGHFWFGSIFLVNVPIVVVALVSGWFLIPASRDPERAPLDPGGAALSIIGISVLIFGLIQAPGAGWGSVETLTAFAVGLAVLGAFVIWERHLEQPMLDMHYFTDPSFSAGSAGTILSFCALFGTMFLLTQYFQLVLGYSPLSAAVRLLPMTPIMIVVSPLTPGLASRFGSNRTVAAGMALLTVGLLMFRGLELRSSYSYVLASLIPLVVGFSLILAPLTDAIMRTVPERRAGAGSAMNDASREFGVAVGVAALGSVAASLFARSFDRSAILLPAGARASARSSLGDALDVARRLSVPTGRALALEAKRAFVSGFHFASTVGAVLAAIAAIVVYFYLPCDRSRGRESEDTIRVAEEAAELGVAAIIPPRRPRVVHRPADADLGGTTGSSLGATKEPR